MKKLLLALMVLATLASCGKNNKVSSNPNAYGSSAITIADSTGQALGSLINSSENAFGNGLISGSALTWNQAIAQYPYYSYKYGTTTGGSSNCSTKWGIFYVCSSGSSSGSAAVTRSVIANSVDITTKRNELASIVNNAVTGGIVSSGSQIYYVRTSAGLMYTIDTRLPIQANPSAVQQVNGQMEYFLGLYQ